MKWTKEDDNNLKTLLDLNKSYRDISIEMNKTIKSISCRCSRLQLKSKVIHHKEIFCKNCGAKIKTKLSDSRLFCNSSCSAKFNLIGRVHSTETKNKIREKNRGKTYPSRTININKVKSPLKNGTENKLCKIKIKHNPYSVPIEIKEIKIKTCRFCGKEKFIENHKIICTECGFNYYKIYRPLCSFDFNIFDYKNDFDFSLAKKYGWYSPTNKRNNLNGVSKDHIYSVKDGFINKIDHNIIKHPANCRIIKHTENSSKNSKSLITIDELLVKIKYWNESHNMGSIV